MARYVLAGILLFLSFGAANAAETPLFEKDVWPILRDNCLSCHGGLRAKASLDLRSHASALKGGGSGPVIVAANLDKSLLWQKLAADEMPKGAAKLSAKDKEIIRAWIQAGASAMPAPPELKPAEKPRGAQVVADGIDREIDRALAAAKLNAAAPASDAEFLRRVYLDITGRIPSPEAARAFLANRDKDKRDKLIDELLGSPEYGRHFSMVWHHQLLPLNGEAKRDYNEPFLAWLSAEFNQSRPWSQIVGAMLTAEGDIKKEPRAAYLGGKAEIGPLVLQTGRNFLGINLECAECHNHPLTHWRQKEDYWGFAGFFAQTSLKMKISEKPVSKPGIKIPTSALTSIGEFVPASFPGSIGPVDGTVGNRMGFSQWLASPENPYFATATVNRWWNHFFGRGLVNPIDDLRPTNPASHPAVLALLADEFRASGHDLKHLIRCLCRTQAYRRSSQGPDGQRSHPELYDRMALKVLTPDMLYDALLSAFDQIELRGVPKLPPRPGQKETPELIRAQRRFIFVNRFGSSDETPPPTEYNHGEPQVLTLINILDGNGEPDRLKKLLDMEAPPAQRIEELYLATLSRMPTTAEQHLLTDYLTKQANARGAYTTILWGLINASEFVFNH